MENITAEQIKNVIESYYETPEGKYLKEENERFQEWLSAQGKGFQENFQQLLRERYLKT